MKHFSFGFRYFDGLFLLTFPFVEVVLAQSAGLEAFTFPASGSKASYNSLDSLNVTWEANNFTNPYLMLWVGTPQELVFNKSVVSLTSIVVPLDYSNAYNNSNFVLQQGPLLNVGAPFSVSGSFEIRNDRSLQPVTWNLANTASSSTSSSASSTTTQAAVTVIPAATFGGSTSSSSSAPPASASSASTNTPLIAGLATLAVLLFLLLLGLAIFFFRRNRHSQEARPQLPDKPHAYHPDKCAYCDSHSDSHGDVRHGAHGAPIIASPAKGQTMELGDQTHPAMGGAGGVVVSEMPGFRGWELPDNEAEESEGERKSRNRRESRRKSLEEKKGSD
ncbi:MAG: hypothetical protein LQ340_001099 [Diploschistes diacapsis]|nr:MAG: hypothetical protein LQ340_001099 [Diploschistes diacapsis]